MEHIGYFLHDIYFSKKSGTLVFKQKRIQKYLFFQSGVLVSAKSTHPQELLGEILLKLGRISVDTYRKIDQYIDPTESLGKILITNKIITERDLIESLLYQMREITLNIFPNLDGVLRFQERENFREREFLYKMSVLDLIEEGIRRMDYNPYFQEVMEKKFPVPKKRDFIHRLTPEERALLDVIDGTSTAGEIFKSSKFQPEFFWMTMYLLYCLDLIDIQDEKKKPEKKPKIKKKVRPKKEKVKKAPPPKKEKKTDKDEEEKPREVMDEKLKKKIAEVEEFREKLSGVDHYQVLQVEKSASQAEIKKAYFNLARKYHPDLFDRDLPPDAKETVDDVFAQITRAFQTLTDEQEKERYDDELEASEYKKETPEKTAQTKYLQAKSLYRRQRYEDALVFLEEAVRIKSTKASYYLLLAKTEAKVPSFRQKAEEDYKKAIELEPWNAEAYAELGKFYKDEGLNVKAKKQFKKALEIDPSQGIARKGLGLSEKEEKKKGLTGIFKDLAEKAKKKI